MKQAESQDLDAALMDLLYEEEAGPRAVGGELREQLSERHAEALQAYRQIQTSYRGFPEKDPPARISAMLLREAEQAASRSAAGFLDRILDLFRGRTMGIAGAAAAAVLVLGVSLFVMQRPAEDSLSGASDIADRRVAAPAHESAAAATSVPEARAALADDLAGSEAKAPEAVYFTAEDNKSSSPKPGYAAVPKEPLRRDDKPRGPGGALAKKKMALAEDGENATIVNGLARDAAEKAGKDVSGEADVHRSGLLAAKRGRCSEADSATSKLSGREADEVRLETAKCFERKKDFKRAIELNRKVAAGHPTLKGVAVDNIARLEAMSADAEATHDSATAKARPVKPGPKKAAKKTKADAFEASDE